MISKFIFATLLSTCLITNIWADSLVIPITHGANDAEEREDGSIYLDSTDLELTQETGTQTIGLRFTGVWIPVGSQIDSAYVQFRADENSEGFTALKISGEATPNAGPFTSTAASISTRPLTTSQINWSPADWSIGSRGPEQQTPDLSSILQEIIDAGSWGSGQSMVLVISGTGKRVAQSFEGDNSNSATLHINFTPATNDTDDSDLLKVAFIGDQGVGPSAQQVLRLIADEGTELLLIQGDLGYKDNTAQQWEENLNNLLGVDFPVLTVVGNHENFEWPLYQALIKNRISRVDSLANACAGAPGVKLFCQYENLDIVQVAEGIGDWLGGASSDNYPEFITDSFNSVSDTQIPRWRICSWHKNQTKMQTGVKGNEVGWDAYNVVYRLVRWLQLGMNTRIPEPF